MTIKRQEAAIRFTVHPQRGPSMGTEPSSGWLRGVSAGTAGTPQRRRTLGVTASVSSFSWQVKSQSLPAPATELTVHSAEPLDLRGVGAQALLSGPRLLPGIMTVMGTVVTTGHQAGPARHAFCLSAQSAFTVTLREETLLTPVWL